MTELELVVRYVGFGLSCHSCGRVRETTRYEIRHKEDLLQEFRLCDECQDNGYVVKFTPKEAKERLLERRRRVKMSIRMEKDLAVDMGGERQPGSGNRDQKGDVRVVGEWRLEHKYTDNVVGYSLRISDLATVIRHANIAGEWPAMVINFRKHNRRFVVLPYEVFLELKAGEE